jgi:hypothetical protein
MAPQSMKILVTATFYPFTSLRLKFELLRFIFIGTLCDEACREAIEKNFITIITDCCDVTVHEKWECMYLPPRFEHTPLVKVGRLIFILFY